MIRDRSVLAAALLYWSCGVCVVSALHRTDLVSYGALSGDLILAEGDDETSRVLTLPRPLYFYDTPFHQLYVATNGIISAQDLPMEKQYVDDGFPTDFPVVAPFLADIDTSGGRGHIYYRVTETPSVLNRVEVRRGFPDAKFAPTHAVVATWENVAAYEDQTQGTELSNKVNTFQAVIGYDETDSYTLFLYPEDGLNFFGTQPKELYNVKIELPARVGFSRGEVTFFIFSRSEGPFYSVTTDEKSVKRLSQVGNTGIPGVWLFHTGNRHSFENIIPAAIGGLLSTLPPEGHALSPVTLMFPFSRTLKMTQVVEVNPSPENEPPLSPGGYVVSVDEEDVDFDTGVIQYTTENKETCARFQQQCSQNAICSDYATGFCCHCRPGFYGNGRQCLPDGAPQRVSGKVSGTVTVGSFPIVLDNIDLHAYIVVGDGRAYTAISQVPEPVGWALMPVSPVGELFGWLFALELPNSQAGFKTTGAEFTRHAEVLFNPGNQRLSIIQTGSGLDEHNHLRVETIVSGHVPLLPPGAEVTVQPFKETYQYYPSVITSSSVREFVVVSAERGSQSYTFHLKQNITYRDCRHDNRATPETLQITMERVFVMYVKEERILRYAITNKISPVGAGSDDELLNPCYVGNHDCDTTAQCIPLEGQAFKCQCATGYTGDGHNCYDIDECAEGSDLCGDHSQCLNLPGSHRCQCWEGFEMAFDGRNCVDIDECSSSPCHINARCINDLGSFRCHCQPGFHGDGFYCALQEGRPKSQCEQHRDSLQSGGHGDGAHIPQCDSDGRYRSLQCHGSTGHCWCVDDKGQERPGTRTPPGTPHVDCRRPEGPKTHCELHRDRVQHTGPDGHPIVGAHIPQCDEHGHYQPQQCHGSTGHCWCVDDRGQERPGTRTPPGTPHVDCRRPGETHCELHRDRVQHTGPDGHPIVGAHIPQCDEHGHYQPQQCHGSTGHCWCVDDKGQERPGTRTPPGTPHVDCRRPEHPKTHCEQHRDRVQVTSPGGHPIEGTYVPQCDEHGHYQPQQCHGSTGQCWCVDDRGQERPGTRTPPGTPRDCAKPGRPKTPCEQHRDRVQATTREGYPVVGGYEPRCDAEGQYLPQQCHGSNGHCWCVDSSGQERPGTRTPPDTPPKDCSKPVCFPHPAASTSRPESVCERWRASLMEHYGGKPDPQQYLPQCEPAGEFSPVQCYGHTTYCWCVDENGREVPGTRSHDVVKPACLPSVTPPTARPLPRPNVTPPPNADVTLLYAQGQKIGALPLNGTRLDSSRSRTLLTLHGSIVVGIAYDCKENQVYWTDLSARTINRASMVSGAEPEILINSNLVSPEGLAVDVKRRLMFWVDSSPDVIESANLDGSRRRILFDTDLVNPRAIIVVSSTGTLYWTDWNREAPKIESSSVDGLNRRVVVSDGVGLPNALTYDSSSGQVCWADAGTKRLECISPNGSGRRVIHPTLNYPFSMVYYRNHFYYTDWRRDGVIAVSKDSSKFTDEYLPEQRSHLYGVTIATTYCLPGKINI
uniref:Nidogen 2 n=1 Tax=Nothobranchius furzeri TaxID=105023 RepID=A0A8C6KHZ8_NOTFU